MKKAVFLDRDGTINDNRGDYVNKADEMELYPFAAEALSRLNKAGFIVLVVTNQGGIARGYLTVDDLDQIHQKFEADLEENGAYVDEIYYSPYFEKGHVKPFDVKHSDRKPDIGMFRKARDKHDIDPKRSYMIGDKYTDVEFGKNAGMRSILLLTGDGEKEFMKKRSNWKVNPDFITSDLSSAVDLILELEKND